MSKTGKNCLKPSLELCDQTWLIFYPQVLNKKDVKGDMDDDGEDYTLTPGTEAQYRQVDQEYAKVMQQTPRTELVSLANFSFKLWVPPRALSLGE